KAVDERLDRVDLLAEERRTELLRLADDALALLLEPAAHDEDGAAGARAPVEGARETRLRRFDRVDTLQRRESAGGRQRVHVDAAALLLYGPCASLHCVDRRLRVPEPRPRELEHPPCSRERLLVGSVHRGAGG